MADMKLPHYTLTNLFWETTLRCNAFCKFCGSWCGEVSCGELSTEEILNAFRSVAEAYDPGHIMIMVTGGEPLLRSDLFEVMGQCVSMGFPWGMVTNGLLITEQVVEKLRQTELKTLSVSIDGLAETHDSLRGVPGAFRRAENAVRLLKEAAFLAHLQVITVVSKKNISQLDEFYEHLKPLGLDSWRLVMVDPIGRAQENDGLLLGRAELERFLNFIAEHKNDQTLPVRTACSHYFGDMNSSIGRVRFKCRTGVNIASILANGDIYVCPNVPRVPGLIQGNVKVDSLPEIWEKGFQFFRDPSCRQAGMCKSCSDWSGCRGDSMHTWDFAENRPKFCYNAWREQPGPVM